MEGNWSIGMDEPVQENVWSEYGRINSDKH